MSDPVNPPSMPAERPPMAIVLPYATPLANILDNQGIWRQGDLLVTTCRAVLPQRCVKCNAPADGTYQWRKFYWIHPAWLLLIFVSWLVLLIIYLCIRKRADIQLGLCTQHRKRRNWMIALAWLLVLAGVGSLIAGPIAADAYHSGVFAAVGILVGIAFFVCAIFAGLAARLIVPKRIDERHAWFKGCGDQFLSEFSSTG